MKVKRIVFINRAPFRNLDIDFSDSQVVSLTGINGAGKTTLLSYIVDAFYEIVRKGFQQEFSGIKEGKLYRVSSPLYNMAGTECSLVYISFELDGKEVYYVDFLGNVNEEAFIGLLSPIWQNIDISNWPIQFGTVKNQLAHGENYAKLITIDEDDARKAFLNNLLTYFPSYRYEQPGYLNDVFQMELKYKYTSDFSGYLTNPIEVTSDLPQIANWMMDIVLDNYLYGNNDLSQKLQYLISLILSYKHKKAVRIGIGQRNMGGARIQIVDAQTGSQIYPTIFNISAGEASLLCLFGELIRQADKLGKKTENIEGIVLIDEVDKHLHIVLQKEVIPQLVQMFPRIQFVLSTHSAYVNIGLADAMPNKCQILDLDNNGIECEASKNDVFREAYEAITKENERYLEFSSVLSERVKDITKPIVYLEGRTDEKYFRKALEVFGFENENIDFQWIGHIDSKGNEAFTGSGSLNYGMQFITGRKPLILHFFLFDCDTKREESDNGNIVSITVPYFDNHIIMNKGIENALELDDIDISAFYEEHIKNGDYGKVVTTRELDKMKMCDYICELDKDSQKKILSNFKPIIERILARAKQHTTTG